VSAVHETGAGLQSKQVDFSKSEIRYLETSVREQEPVSYEIILRNTGSRRVESVTLGNPLSSGTAMLASASREMVYDANNRFLRWQGNMDPGGERRFTVTLITLPGSFNNLIVSHATIGWDGGKHNMQAETTVTLPERTSLGQFLFIAGGIGFKWLEVMILGYLLFILLFLIVVPPLMRRRERLRFERSPDVSWHEEDPRRIKQTAMTIALLISLAFMPLFLSEMIEDVRRFVSYEKATCTVLDKKAGGLPGSRGVYPIVSVHYVAQGKEIISAGSLDKGASSKETSAEEKIALYDCGKSYACWFDPGNPKKFILNRADITWGFYLLFLPVFAFIFFTSRYFLRRLRGTTEHVRIEPE